MKNQKAMQLLLVEDNADDVTITRRALLISDTKSDLHVARDGQEALDFMFRSAEFGAETPRPDLVLLDINLPKVSGIDVLSHIRANPETAMVPVVMLTASAREEDVARSYKLGANTYIQKPVEFEKFLHALGLLGQYWVAVATPPPAAATAA